MGGCSVSPEDVRGEGWPLGVVAFAGLDKGVTNCPVLLLDDAIRTKVVWGNADVSDTIPIRKPVECGDIGRAVVSDNLFDGTPSA